MEARLPGNHMKIWSIIPARGGSKGVPNKNIRLLGGYPLIAYSIMASHMATNISRTIVSTDSEQIADIARRYGADVPFMRPDILASDAATDIDWVNHALGYFHDTHDIPDFIVHLRPTTPLRDPVVIDTVINQYMYSSAYVTSMRSAHQIPEHPYKMFVRDGTYFKPFGDASVSNNPRQSFPPVYVPNGYIDILDVQHILSTGTLHGDAIMAYETPPVIEIDTMQDLIDAELHIKSCPVYYRLS